MYSSSILKAKVVLPETQDGKLIFQHLHRDAGISDPPLPVPDSRRPASCLCCWIWVCPCLMVDPAVHGPLPLPLRGCSITLDIIPTSHLDSAWYTCEDIAVQYLREVMKVQLAGQG